MHPIIENEDPYVTARINSFVTRSLRDVADKDYIAARACYRVRLDQPFLTTAHQALEKYGKAILIFNRRSAKNLGHNLSKIYRRVANIQHIDVQIPDDVLGFIDYFDSHGRSRYFEGSYYLRGLELPRLDCAVWTVRRYCFHIHHVVRSQGRTIDMAPIYNSVINDSKYDDFPNKFPRQFTGYLEEVKREKHGKEVREQFLWKNMFFGRNRRKVRLNRIAYSANSPLAMEPATYEMVSKYIDFSKEVREWAKESRSNLPDK